jgi:hypothetical protein
MVANNGRAASSVKAEPAKAGAAGPRRNSERGPKFCQSEDTVVKLLKTAILALSLTVTATVGRAAFARRRNTLRCALRAA